LDTPRKGTQLPALRRSGDQMVVAIADDLADVRRVRHLAAAALGQVLDEERRADALLVISELVTNALLHAPGPRSLTLRLSDGGVDVAVEDASSTLPAPANDPSGVTGRGRLLVSHLSSRSGTTVLPGGKRVWCHLDPDGPARGADRTPE
jgi:two-component sensor histidine kinase